MELCWFILYRDFSQLLVPAVQHDRCVCFFMQVYPYIDDILFSQVPSFLFLLSTSSARNPLATSTDKRYVPIYAQRPRPSQGGTSLSVPITKGFTGYSSQRFSPLEVCRMLPLMTDGFKSYPGYFSDLCKMLPKPSLGLLLCGIDFNRNFQYPLWQRR